ncbi:hypothetical protein TeGR_g12782 [Tetraparma gracilis]|uniref:Uncharacterized protein n=1 Tax=Tetraparma gracilis TaxID=2962635 RepID=A0ABQ6M3C2_9STRA|nr:hypothetical protein TeGR_g12782 [Tetraparma gracilis]
MICEAIPGCVMQLYVCVGVLQDGKSVTNQAVLSLVVSALSTGYSSSSITYDYDTGVQRRKDEPEFYGFIPDGTSGTVVFGCMTLNGGLLLLARSASAALLMHVKSSYFLYYVLGDCAFFFLQKAARGDIRYFTNLDGWAGTVLGDFLGQLIFKLIVDYTGLVQFRGAGCLGGSYWTGNMLLALAAPFGAVAIFFASDVSTDSSLDESSAWTFVLSLCGAWVLVFFIFLLLVNPSHRHTFYSTQTSKAWVCSYFTKEGATDASKMSIHQSRRRLWKHLRPEVKEWTLANWARFEREDPDWFSPSLIAQVEDDMIPPGSLAGLNREGGGKRRRNSMSERLLGGSAMSVRERANNSRVTPG